MPKGIAEGIKETNDHQLKAHYESILAEHIPTEHVEIVDYGMRDDFTQFTLDEETPKKMKNNKSSGRNDIIAEQTKQRGTHLKEILLQRFNEFRMNRMTIPKEWIDAEVISIYKKKGSKKDPNNYRSIFLLDVIGKLYAAMVCKRLYEVMRPRLEETQYGFRPNKSTVQAITTVRACVQKCIDRKSPLVLTFVVDLTKTFDSILKGSILNALIEFESPNKLKKQ